jgi:hypothetical protein
VRVSFGRDELLLIRGSAAWCEATKWLNRIARGFSPGLVPRRIRLESIQPRSRGVQFVTSATLRSSSTPTPRLPGFVDSLSAVAFALCSRSASQARRAPRRVRQRRRKNDDEDEYEAPHEGGRQVQVCSSPANGLQPWMAGNKSSFGRPFRPHPR